VRRQVEGGGEVLRRIRSQTGIAGTQKLKNKKVDIKAQVRMTSAPKEVRELKFKVLKEDWFVYKLKDGSIIKIKPVLISVYETDMISPETGKPILAFKGQNIVVVKSPEGLKGEPTLPLPPPSEALKLSKEEVDVEESIYEPPWNRYELENGDVIKQKLVLINVYKIKGMYDVEGNPYYVVQSQIVSGSSSIRIIDPFPQSTYGGFELRFTPDFYSFLVFSSNSLHIPLIFNRADPLYIWGLLKKTPSKEIGMVKREILTNTLAEVIKADWSEIKGEVKELLKDYEVAPEYVELVISEVRKKVRSKLQGLPNEDWLTEILSKLYIRIAYGLLHT